MASVTDHSDSLPTHVVSESPSVTSSSGQLREISVVGVRIDTNNQVVTTSLCDEPLVRQLRAQFSSVRLVSVTLRAATLTTLGAVANPEPIRFGMIPAKLNGMAQANIYSYRGLVGIGLSALQINFANNTHIPPGCELDFARTAIGAGHPEIVMVSAGNMANPAGPVAGAAPVAIDLAEVIATLKFAVEGTGPGYEYDI